MAGVSRQSGHEKDVVEVKNDIFKVQISLEQFSKSLASLHRIILVEQSNEYSLTVNDLRKDISRNAEEYVTTIFPLYGRLAQDIDNFFDLYLDYEFCEWNKKLDSILPLIRDLLSRCKKLLEVHEKTLLGFKRNQRKSEEVEDRLSTSIAKQFSQLKLHEKEAEEHQKKANRYFYSLVGIPFGYSRNKEKAEEAKRNAEEKRSIVRQHENAMEVVKEGTTSLEHVIQGLNSLHIFFKEIEFDLEKYQRNIEKSSKLEDIGGNHYDKMKALAPGIQETCKSFFHALPIIKTDFLALV